MRGRNCQQDEAQDVGLHLIFVGPGSGNYFDGPPNTQSGRGRSDDPPGKVALQHWGTSVSRGGRAAHWWDRAAFKGAGGCSNGQLGFAFLAVVASDPRLKHFQKRSIPTDYGRSLRKGCSRALLRSHVL